MTGAPSVTKEGVEEQHGWLPIVLPFLRKFYPPHPSWGLSGIAVDGAE